jgi:outer membrane immunogenic protein
MRRHIAAVALGATVLSGGSAWAADPVDPVYYDWTGFYIGAHGGYAFGGKDDVGISTNGVSPFVDAGRLTLDGLYGGGQVGYNWQSDYWVFGLSADISAGNVNDRENFNDTVQGVSGFTRSDVDVFGTLRGNAGYAFDRTYLYGTGGLAWGDVDYHQFSVDNVGNTFTIDQNKLDLGFALGGGLKYAVTDDVRIGVEYLYVNLYGDTLTGTVVDAGGLPNGVFASTVRTTDFHTVRFNVDWRF